MALKDLFRRHRETIPHEADARPSGGGRGYHISFNGSPLRGLLLLPVALFSLFIALLAFLPFLLKTTWRLAKMAGQVDAKRNATGPHSSSAYDDDVIDI